MKHKTYLNGSRETPAQAVARIETQLNKLRDDVKRIASPGKPRREIQNSMGQDPFQKFLKTHVIDKRNGHV